MDKETWQETPGLSAAAGFLSLACSSPSHSLAKCCAFVYLGGMRIYFALPILLAVLLNCGKKTGKPDYSQCSFTYEASATQLQWTAYKFTERLGVPGSFNSVELMGAHAAKDPASVFDGATFRVDGLSVNTNNAERDQKIRTAFFAALKDKGAITGKVIAPPAGAASFVLKLNGVEKTIPATVDRSALPELKVSFALDLADFNALGPLAALNKVCSDLHKGKDGKSKLWPDIQVSISTRLNAQCPGQ